MPTMVNSSISEWMYAKDDQERDIITTEIAGSMDLGVMDVPSLLRELRPYLNSEATLIEAGDGMRVLSEILRRLQTDLGRINLHAMVEYLCLRLENKEEIPNFRAGVKDAALSLQALASMTARFPRGDASLAVKAVFSLSSTSLRDQQPATRLCLFELLFFLVDTYSATLVRDMGTRAFVEGLVDMSAFEKDPKCLRLLFQMYHKISQTWTLKSDDFEKIWGSFSKYWPISFREKPSDPSIPTTQELNFLIQQCFTSNDNYAVHAFSHLLEVLDTSQDTVTTYTKNSVLEAFRACFDAYSFSIATEYCSKVWDALKFEIWDGTNKDFIDRTVSILIAIVSKLDTHYSDWKALDTALAKFVVAASTECCQRLHDSKQQHILGTGQILRALGSKSHIAFSLSIRYILPQMLLMWEDAGSRDRKLLLLYVFNQILRTRLDLRDMAILNTVGPTQTPNDIQRIQADEILISCDLENFRQSLVDDVYIAAMMERNSEDPAVDTPFLVNTIQGLVSGARIDTFLSDYHKGTIISKFNDLILDRNQKQAVHDEVVDALLCIHIEDPGRFRDITIPNFMAALPSRISTDKETHAQELIEIVFVLEAFIKVACTKSCRVDIVPPPTYATTNFKFRLFDGLQRSLMDKIFSIIPIPNQLLYINALLAAMFRGLQSFDKVLAEDEGNGVLVPVLFPEINPYAWIVLELYRKVIKQKKHEHGILARLSYMGLNIVLDEDERVNGMFVSLLGRIATFALRSSQSSSINNFLFNTGKEKKESQIWLLFSEEEPQSLLESAQQNLEEGPADKCFANVLSMSLVAGVRREDKGQLNIKIGNAAYSMIKNAISTKNNDCSPYARVSMLNFLQLLINKFGATKEKIENEDRSLPQVMLDLAASCIAKTNELEIERTYQTLVYFAAACLASSDPFDKLLIDQMVIGMLDPRVGRKVAQSFRILLQTSVVVNETNFCVVRKLRKHRLYGMIGDHLISQWRTNPNKDQKEKYLIALAGIFAYMDPGILEAVAEDTFPLILQGTNVNDEFTMYTYIILINTLIVACPDVVSSHIDSVINRMTDRTHNTYDSPSDASVKCRTAALEVLGRLVGWVDSRKLLQRKSKVLIELDIALDDCSRTVRSVAERTKMKWFNLVEAEA